MSNNAKLKIYGTWISQPTRAVAWMCELNSIPYEMIDMPPTISRKVPKREKFINEINPTGRIPALHDIENDVKLYESAAILTYIATKYNLQEYYPNGTESESHLKRRALIDQMLHWHHENVRLITLSYIGPLMRVDVKIEKWMQLSGQMINQRKLLKYTFKTLNERHFNKNKFIIDDYISVADLL